MSEEVDAGPQVNELEESIMRHAGWRNADDFPESLFHYTSSAAFLNIIQSGELWFSDFKYMNDLSELKYGRHGARFNRASHARLYVREMVAS